MLHLKNNKKTETAFVYKFGLECFGKSIEYGISYGELLNLKEKSRWLVTTTKDYFASMKSMIGKNGKTTKDDTSKKRATHTDGPKKTVTRPSSEREHRTL